MVETVENKPSNRSLLRVPYEAIMDTAKPGDPVFFISDNGEIANDNRLRRLNRKWRGVLEGDTTNWHTAIYAGAKKEGKAKGPHYRPYMIQAKPIKDDVEEQYVVTEVRVPDKYFVNKYQNEQLIQQCRFEVIHNPDIDQHQREAVIDYARDLMETHPTYENDGWRNDSITYVLGIRNLHPRDPNQVSCHGMVFDAYAKAAGYHFQHQLKHAPNILGRVFGHPLGHPSDYVDTDYLYLRDQNLYLDPGFKATLAIIGDHDLESVKIEHNPQKFSWNSAAQAAYGLLAL